jgi:hypothetical protein
MAGTTFTSAAASPHGTAAAASYALTSDLAAFCLPAAGRDPNRKYAYACSVFSAVVLVGAIGIVRVERLVIKELPPVQEAMQVEIPQTEQPAPPTPDDQPKDFNPSPETVAEAPPMPVIVAAADANVPFAIPTFGNVTVTGLVARASAPPPMSFVPKPPPAPAQKPEPAVFKRASRPRGSFPEPPFPTGMLRSGQTVDLTLTVEVAETGSPEKVEVAASSGIYELDRKVAQHVKSRWHWEPGQARLWTVPFGFQCN